MKQALTNVSECLAKDGLLFIAIYNDQDIISKVWNKVKWLYCSGALGKYLITFSFIPYFVIQSTLAGLIKHRNPLSIFSTYKKKRGMSIYYDWLDWLGGYPFEVAKPEEIINFYKKKGLLLQELITTNRLGCNQFLFQKNNL